MSPNPRPRCPTHDVPLRAAYSRHGATATYIPIPTAYECPEDGLVHQPRTLDELTTFLRGRAYDESLDWTNLPTYGGNHPDDTHQVWSWDETRLLIGSCADDLEIVARSEYAEQ